MSHLLYMVCLQVSYACLLADAYLLCNSQPLRPANAKDAAYCQVEPRSIWQHCLSYHQRHCVLLLLYSLLVLLRFAPCSLSLQSV